MKSIAFNYDGSYVPGWPTQPTGGYGYARHNSVADLGGDGVNEIVARADFPDIILHMFDPNLNELPGWPMTLSSAAGGVYKVLAVADLDGDNDLEIGYADGEDIYFLDVPNPSGNPVSVQWGLWNHDVCRTSSPSGKIRLEQAFVRGDSNGYGQMDIADAVFTLESLFLPGAPATDCHDAADTNDGAVVDIADAVFTLGAMFGGWPSPSPDCLDDPTYDFVTCVYFACP